MVVLRLGWLLLQLAVGLAAPCCTLFVSTQGNDANSGCLPDQALQSVRAAIAAARNCGGGAPKTILLRNETHFLDSTLHMDGRDSNLTVSTYVTGGGEGSSSATVSGGLLLSDVTETFLPGAPATRAWVAKLTPSTGPQPSVRIVGGSAPATGKINQLWVNGFRRVRARSAMKQWQSPLPWMTQDLTAEARAGSNTSSYVEEEGRLTGRGDNNRSFQSVAPPTLPPSCESPIFRKLQADDCLERLLGAQSSSGGGSGGSLSLRPVAGAHGFVFSDPDDIPEEAGGNHSEALIVAYRSWTTALLRVDSVFRDNKTVTFSNRAHYPFGFFPQSGRRYWVENLRSLLDEKGEFFFDTSTGVLTYLPFDNETISNSQLVADRPGAMENLISVVGSSSSSSASASASASPNFGSAAAPTAAENIAFNNIAFSHSSWAMPRRDEVVDSQAASNSNTSLVFVRNASRVSFTRCSFSRTGWGYALWIETGTSQCTVVNNRFFDLGSGGVRLGGCTPDPYNPPDVQVCSDVRAGGVAPPCTGHTVSGNVIQDGGKILAQGVGILVTKASQLRLTDNVVSGFSWSGVSVGWTWGYANDSVTADNIVANNTIKDIGRKELNDLGGIYTLGISPHSQIYGNTVSDVAAFQGDLAYGIYLDEGTSGVAVSSNTVTGVSGAGFFQHYGQRNVLQHNVFSSVNNAALDSAVVIGYDRWSPDLPPSSIEFINNTVQVGLDGKAICIQGSLEADAKDYTQVNFDFNSYDAANGSKAVTVIVGSRDKARTLSFVDWQKSEMQDQHSSVIH